MTKKKAVFLDRDGVVNRKLPEGRYVTRWEELELLPGVADAIAQLNRAGYLVFVATNQRGVAKGLMSLGELDEIHRRLIAELGSQDAVITQIYSCPHDNLPPCRCRKPAPGMLLDAAEDHDLDLSASWMIGDSARDIQAGQNAGCRTIRITPQPEPVAVWSVSNRETPSAAVPEPVADLSAANLASAVKQLLLQED